MVKEYKFDREVDNKPMELGLLSLNPLKDSFLRVLKRAMEDGIDLVVVPLIIASTYLGFSKRKKHKLIWLVIESVSKYSNTLKKWDFLKSYT